MTATLKNKRRLRRRGTIYVVVLLASLLVATIGLSSLYLVRVQAKTAVTGGDFAQARIYARSGIEIAMLKIRNDAYWRTNLGNGNWMVNQAIGSGTYSISAVDPVDNDVTKGDNHPVVLTATGVSGAATYKSSIRLEVGPRVNSCMEVSMCCTNDFEVTSATLTSNQVICSNRKMIASSATVNADAEGYSQVSGSTYQKTTTKRTTIRQMPDSDTALNFYLTSGVVIPYTSLTKWGQTELVTNPLFETNITGWYAKTNCTLSQSATYHKQGSYSLMVSARNANGDGAAQDLPLTSLQNGNSYTLSIPVRPTSNCNAYALLTITSTGDGVQTYPTSSVSFSADGSGNYPWYTLTGTVTPTWTGTLTKATISTVFNAKTDYYLDDVSVIDTTYPTNNYVMDRKLLSPSVNPYGATQAQGIYVIDCDGKTVNVSRSRIVGTLVLLNPNNNSKITGSCCFEAAVYNYPALLSDKTLFIDLASGALSESFIGVNLNPTGTPYPYLSGGTTNATTSDSYPSKIQGLVYSKNDVQFTTAPTVNGIVLADGKIKVLATSMSCTYNNVYYTDPPPGFDVGLVEMKTLPGTFKRVVD